MDKKFVRKETLGIIGQPAETGLDEDGDHGGSSKRPSSDCEIGEVLTGD